MGLQLTGTSDAILCEGQGLFCVEDGEVTSDDIHKQASHILICHFSVTPAGLCMKKRRSENCVHLSEQMNKPASNFVVKAAALLS